MLTLDDITAAVTDAAGRQAPLYLVGGGSKSHIGHALPAGAEPFSLRDHEGIVDYHPEELVVRVRAGTPVAELKKALASEGQMLGFDPPDHAGRATIGGVISAGLSGSRRPFAGSARDFVLGVGLVLADGCYREFGGQVMKNVAGYDVSRLVCGAWGTLGLIADVSLKVLPAPEREASVSLAMDIDAARAHVNELRSGVSGLSACCYRDGTLNLRFSGTADVVGAVLAESGGDALDERFWDEVDTQAFVAGELWRLSTDPAEPVDHEFAWMDWCFGQRWLAGSGSDPRQDYRGAGHWTRWDAEGDGEPFSQPQGLMALQRQIKQAFDPIGLFNPGRMYRDI